MNFARIFEQADSQKKAENDMYNAIREAYRDLNEEEIVDLIETTSPRRVNLGSSPNRVDLSSTSELPKKPKPSTISGVSSSTSPKYKKGYREPDSVIAARRKTNAVMGKLPLNNDFKKSEKKAAQAAAAQKRVSQIHPDKLKGRGGAREFRTRDAEFAAERAAVVKSAADAANGTKDVLNKAPKQSKLFNFAKKNWKKAAIGAAVGTAIYRAGKNSNSSNSEYVYESAYRDALAESRDTDLDEDDDEGVKDSSKRLCDCKKGCKCKNCMSESVDEISIYVGDGPSPKKKKKKMKAPKVSASPPQKVSESTDPKHTWSSRVGKLEKFPPPPPKTNPNGPMRYQAERAKINNKERTALGKTTEKSHDWSERVGNLEELPSKKQSASSEYNRVLDKALANFGESRKKKDDLILGLPKEDVAKTALFAPLVMGVGALALKRFGKTNPVPNRPNTDLVKLVDWKRTNSPHSSSVVEQVSQHSRSRPLSARPVQFPLEGAEINRIKVVDGWPRKLESKKKLLTESPGLIEPDVARKILEEFENLSRSKKSSDSPFASLTPREEELLTMIIQGKPNKMIGDHFDISPNTVRNHLASIFSKIKANNRTEAALKAFQAKRSDIPGVAPDKGKLKKYPENFKTYDAKSPTAEDLGTLDKILFAIEELRKQLGAYGNAPHGAKIYKDTLSAVYSALLSWRDPGLDKAASLVQSFKFLEAKKIIEEVKSSMEKARKKDQKIEDRLNVPVEELAERNWRKKQDYRAKEYTKRRLKTHIANVATGRYRDRYDF